MRLEQARAYCAIVGVPFKLSSSNSRFRFGAGRSRSLSKIPIIITTSRRIFLPWIDVFFQYIPLLIDLDVLDKHYLQILSAFENWSVSASNGWYRSGESKGYFIGSGTWNAHFLQPTPARTSPQAFPTLFLKEIVQLISPCQTGAAHPRKNAYLRRNSTIM